MLTIFYRYFFNSEEKIQDALNTVLRRKGITASTLTARSQARYSNHYFILESKFRQIQTIEQNITDLYLSYLSVPSFNAREELVQRKAELNKLQWELAGRIPEMDLENYLQNINCQAIAENLPRRSVLFEFACFRVCDITTYQRQNSRFQYLMFAIFSQNPEQIEIIDLGGAEEIDSMVKCFRQSASQRGESGDSSTVEEDDILVVEEEYNFNPAIQLGQKILHPILPFLQEVEHLIFAPDSSLNLIPFGLLPIDEQETLLMDRYIVSYLSVARDILISENNINHSASNSIIIADPDFNLENSESSVDSFLQATILPVNLGSNIYFEPAPGTRMLAQQLAEKLEVQPYLGADALLSHVTNNQSPLILAIATHGVYFTPLSFPLNIFSWLFSYANRVLHFLPEINSWNSEHLYLFIFGYLLLVDLQAQDPLYIMKTKNNLPFFSSHQLMEEQGIDIDINRLSAAEKVEDPMMRSALALAGANTWTRIGSLSQYAGKGLLFAQDVAMLDLHATELAILSACKTGVGDITHKGEGVFGLRRAFAIAGAKTLIMSLWSVPDKVTALLMVNLIDNLQDGLGRTESLQKAQNYVRRITVRELLRTELGCEALKERLDIEGELIEEFFAGEEDSTPFKHPFYWGAWICQGKTTPVIQLQSAF